MLNDARVVLLACSVSQILREARRISLEITQFFTCDRGKTLVADLIWVVGGVAGTSPYRIYLGRYGEDDDLLRVPWRFSHWDFCFFGGCQSCVAYYRVFSSLHRVSPLCDVSCPGICLAQRTLRNCGILTMTNMTWFAILALLSGVALLLPHVVVTKRRFPTVTRAVLLASGFSSLCDNVSFPGRKVVSRSASST